VNLFVSTNKKELEEVPSEEEEEKKEDESIKEQATCLICFENPCDSVFLECGHGGVCYECSLDIWKTT